MRWWKQNTLLSCIFEKQISNIVTTTWQTPTAIACEYDYLQDTQTQGLVNKNLGNSGGRFTPCHVEKSSHDPGRF